MIAEVEQAPKKAKLDLAAESNGSKAILAAPLVEAFRPEWFNGAALDPKIVALNERIIHESAGAPELPEVGAEGTRAAKAKFFENGKNFEDLQIPGLDGKQAVGARLFMPENGVVHAALMHIHGGGFISGSAYGQNDVRLETLCENCGLAVLSVEHRLAPEHTFPAANDDCLAAARWLVSEGRARLGCSTLLLVGESSGGNLAASLLLRLRDEGVNAFAAACLVYGMYDASLTPSARNWGKRRLICNTRELEWWIQAYAGEHSNLQDPLLSPLYGNLQGLPPALFVVGTEDALLDDSLFMHARWGAAGNEAALALFPGAPHGVGHFGPHKNTEQGAQVRATIEAFYRKHIPAQTPLLKNHICVLNAIAPSATEQMIPADAIEYWLSVSKFGKLSAMERLAEATQPPTQAKELILLRLLDPPAQSPTTAQLNEKLPGDGVDVGTRLLLSDARVNIWEFMLRPGDSCRFHRHRLPYFFINLTASLTQALAEDGSPTDCPPQLQQKRQTTFVGLEAVGAHGVKNVGGGDFMQFIVEFKLWGRSV